MQVLTSLLFLFFALFSGCQTDIEPESSPCEDAVEKTYVHKYGVKVAKSDWAFRGKEGKVISKLKNGVTVTKNYINGIMDGEAIYTFPHSEKIAKIKTYNNGSLVQETENYFSQSPKKEISYLPQNKIIIKTWYEDGTPKSNEEYEVDKLVSATSYNRNNQAEAHVNNGEGEKINRDGFGLLESKDVFSRGELQSRLTYFSNGAVKEIIPYKQGKICGVKKTFYPGGEPATVEEWENDRQNGVTHVYQNGEKLAEVPYVEGVRQGIEQRFRDGRYLVEEISWKNGFKHGPSYSYVGNEKAVDWYYYGEKVSKAKYEQLKRSGRPIIKPRT